MILNIKDIQFKTLSEHEKVLGSFDPEAQDILNLNLWIPSADKITLVLKDSTAYVELDIPAIVENFTEPAGVRLEYQKFFYILNSYSPQDLAELKLVIIEDDENSSFDIMVGKDLLSLPHIIMERSQLDEFGELHDQLLQASTNNETTVLSFNDIFSPISTFIDGISSCLAFVSQDEKKNNAISVYNGKLIVNDRRHVYTCYGVETNQTIGEFFPLHKKIAKILLQAYFSCPIEMFKVFDSADKAYLQTPNLKCLLNNGMANVAPPTVDDLNAIRPTKKVCDIDIATLRDTTNFFSGFYTSSPDLNPVMIEYSAEKDALQVKLRDSGLRGGSCSIVRDLPGLTIDSDSFEATVINDSLKLFLSKAKKETTAELWIQNEKPSVYLKTEASDIYLAKLV